MDRMPPAPVMQNWVELRPIMTGTPDNVLARLVGTICSEVEAGCPAGLLFLASLGLAAAYYLAQRHGIHPPSSTLPSEGLSPERLLRVMEYIEAHLTSELSVAELAAVACLSPYHFGRMFRRSTGESVHRYVTRRRIERSQELLRTSVLSLAEIAEGVGFTDQSRFTNVFKRHLQMTPGAYRRMAR
jgi:AraC family transcriptional regulator